ncbi:hypothetical protein M404DRAFT_97017, partial [Pisolithus tinctorius Marx 270]
ISLPIAETQLQQLLGESYVDEHWQTVLMTVMNTEGDAVQAMAAVNKLATAATHQTGLMIKIPASHQSLQLTAAEEELKDSVKTLQECKHIFG